jgi:hypothetical protein
VADRGGLYAIGWRAGIFEALADSPASIDAFGGAPGCSERLAPGFVVEYLVDGHDHGS